MPSQGTNIWCDAMVIPQNAENPKLAHEFINYMLTYEAAFDNTETVGYTSPNAEVFEEMTSSEDLYADNAAYLPRSGYDKDEMFHDNQVLMQRDPGYLKHTDHTREYIPMIALGKKITPVNLGTRAGFCDIAATVTELLGVPYQTPGRSLAAELVYEEGRENAHDTGRACPSGACRDEIRLCAVLRLYGRRGAADKEREGLSRLQH